MAEDLSRLGVCRTAVSCLDVGRVVVNRLGSIMISVLRDGWLEVRALVYG